MPRPTMLSLLACLCIQALLAGCSMTPACRPAAPLATPKVIDVPVTLYKPLPSALTTPLALPPAPPEHCSADGVQTVCVLDALMWIEPLRDVIDQANADRALAAKLGAAPATAASTGTP